MVDVIAAWATERQRQRCSPTCSPAGDSATRWPSAAAITPRTSVRGCTAASGLHLTGAQVLHHRGADLALARGLRARRGGPARARDRAAGTPTGVQLDTDWNVMGQRATVSGGATFDDAEVEFVVDYQQAFEVPQQLGARAQLVHAAIEVGIAGGALRDAHWFVTEKARPFFEAARGGWGTDGGRRPPHDSALRAAGDAGARRRAAARRRRGGAAADRARAGRRRRGRPRLDRGRPGEGVRMRDRRPRRV